MGIIVQKEEDRQKGYGKQALGLVISYAFEQLQLHQLYANIGTANEASCKLFTTFGFQLIGVKKEWMLHNNHYQDEALYQLVNHSF